MAKEKKDKKDKKEKKVKVDDEHKVKKSKKESKSTVPTTPETTAALLAAVESKETATENITKPTVLPASQLVPFAHPLANEKSGKKVFKAVKKGAKNKTLKRGVKEVVKALRKSPTNPAGGAANGIVVLAADISPMDVISHIPVLCEDHGVPYIFVSSRAELGAAGGTKRPTSVVMVTPGKKKGKDGKEEEETDGFKEAYDEAVKVMEAEMAKAPGAA